MSGVALAPAWTGIASAQSAGYPDSRVTIVNPFTAGGPTDILGRAISEGLTGRFKQPFVQDYKLGNLQIAALSYLSSAKPDGKTISILASDATAAKLFSKSFTFDVDTAFEPVARMATTPVLLAVPTSINVNSLKEFVAFAKAKADGVNVAVIGITDVLTAGAFKEIGGFNQTQVRYPGGAQSATAVAQGDAHYALLALTALKPMIDRGAVKVLAVLAQNRFAAVPDVPTSAEAGFPQLRLEWWFGVIAPKNTPPTIVKAVGETIVEAMSATKTVETLASIGIVSSPLAGDGLKEVIASDIVRWTDLAKKQGIVPS